MLVHNRIGFAVIGVLMMVVLVGAGCGGAEKPRASGETRNVPSDGTSGDDAAAVDDVGSVPVGSAPIGNVSTDDGAITNWATYRSDALGIAIPYPEGWYVEEGAREGSTVILFDEQPLPSLDEPSDAMAAVGVTIGSFPLADAVRSYGPDAITSTVMLGPRSVTRLDYETELGADNDVRSRSVFLWETEGTTFVVQGDANSSVLTRIAEELASSGERR